MCYPIALLTIVPIIVRSTLFKRKNIFKCRVLKKKFLDGSGCRNTIIEQKCWFFSTFISKIFKGKQTQTNLTLLDSVGFFSIKWLIIG